MTKQTLSHIFLCFLGSLVYAAGCVGIISMATVDNPEKGLTTIEVETRRETLKSYRDWNKVTSIYYIKDPRTGLCYAFYNSSAGHQGYGGMSLVPCESVPKELLIIPAPLPVNFDSHD